MADKIKDILKKVLSVEIADNTNQFYYKAKIKLIMNSEIDFEILRIYDKNKLPFKENDFVTVKLKTEECCYSFEGKCTYIKKGYFFTLSVTYPRNLQREQNREFVRTSIDKELTLFLVCRDENRRKVEMPPNSFSIKLNNVKSVDISGGGMAFYNNIYIKPGTDVVIDLQFVAPELGDLRQKATILRCNKVENNKELYMTAAEFMDIPFAVQERINKFVFTQIRKKAQEKKKSS
ncbi:flagellar brake protein [Pectinatus sottacetonis]|uniref:flagellar brake protein n=1 Tax=Pectinatus sottacetonis TaxID=1002795 RepID=UPI0018C6CDCE|nr:PilZ domain-containing protein [Pectinatus sottacetonis]